MMSTMTASDDRHLSARDLAERWKVSEGWLANRRSAGAGVAYMKLGSRVRYRLSDVQAHEAAALIGASA